MKIFTRTFCPNCDMVKEEMKKLNIKFEEVDVDYFKNKAKLIVRGLKELPVLEHNENYIEFTNMEDLISFISKNND